LFNVVTSAPKVNEDGSLFIRPRLVIPAQEIELRVTTSGGPGGQHANRSLTRVVASFRVADSTVLSASDSALLLEKAAALEQLATRIAAALERPAPRRSTKPTRSSKVRRVDEKKARSRLKVQRRRPDDD
jgi:ribosome-associated protein